MDDQSMTQRDIAATEGDAIAAAGASYRDHGLHAAAYLDHLGAAVTAAAATMRWNGGDAAAVTEVMGRVRANLDAAQSAIDARGEIASGIVAATRGAELTPPGAAAVGVEVVRDPVAPEGHLVAATRALEAVRSQADQALLGFQLAPRMSEVLFAVLDTIQIRADAGREAYLDYVLAQETEGAAR